MVFIYIGINDVWHKYDFGTGSDIDLYEDGLRQIISEIQKIGSKVVLCTPTVIGENHGDFTLANQYVEHSNLWSLSSDQQLIYFLDHLNEHHRMSICLKAY